MKNTIAIICLLICAYTLHAQFISNVTYPDTTSPLVIDTTLVNVKYANTINRADMKRHLYIIASEKMAGRETGSEGNVLAAQYITDQLKSWGVPTPPNMKNYLQPIALTYTTWTNSQLDIGGQKFRLLQDFISLPAENNELPNFTADEILFLGYGIDQNGQRDYDKKKVKGKVILINDGEPMVNDSIYKLTKSKKDAGWTLKRKVALARKKGAKVVFVIPNNFKSFINEKRMYVLSPTVELSNTKDKEIKSPNVIYISNTVVNAIIGKYGREKIQKARDEMAIKGKFDAIPFPIKLSLDFAKHQNLIEGNNIAAYFEGTNKKDEVVIVSAHYDHLGKRGDVIYYGADDNGSGTTTLLEIAEALSIAKKNGIKPNRSILLIWTTGEEKGLLGSQYYVENPIIPINETVADINIDMLGRLDKKYGPLQIKNYTYVIGSDRLSSDLHRINEEVNNKYSRLILDYTYNSANDPNMYFYRSDHYNFSKKGIPSIFFYSGTHQDYHQPGDTPDKIDFEKMEKVGRHVFQLLWELANIPERISADRN